MSQQINLYELRLRPRHDWITGRNVGIVFGVLLAVMIALGVYARLGAGRAVAELNRVQSDVANAQEELVELNKALAERKIPEALQAELDNAKSLLVSRKEVLEILDSGQLGNSTGFSEILYGFARLASADLWLTGFSVTLGGQEIELRGRLLDSKKLPAYVQRLSAEPVFQGRRFATLDVRSVEPEVIPSEAGGPAKNTPPAALTTAAILPPARYVEFVLRSENASSGANEAASNGGQK